MGTPAPVDFTAPLEKALGRRESNTDPIALLLHAVMHEDRDPLRITATVRLLDDEGVPSGYLSGPALVQALTRLYEIMIGAVHTERLRRLDAIEDWTLRPALLDRIVAAIVEPVIDGFHAPHAAALHFCYAGAQRTEIPIPKHLWWSTAVVDRILRHQDVDDRPHFSNAIHVSVQTLERFCSSLVKRQHLPFSADDPAKQGDPYRRTMTRSIRALMDMMLEQA